MAALDPRWCTGVEGKEDEPDDEGVSENDDVGVRRPVGVAKLSESMRLRRVEGVEGNVIEFLDGVPPLLEGVMGNGTANPRNARFAGDIEGDFRFREGDGGVARMETEDGDLGDEDASRRVSVECCLATGKGGRRAIGILGTEAASL